MDVELDRPDRDLFIDALRVVSVAVVVVGHWLTTTVIWEDGRIDGENALSVISETHIATWLFQVMPLLFFVGGFANARSLQRHGRAYLPFLRSRLERLLKPTVLFIGVWLGVSMVGEALPLPEPNLLERGADIAALPFWFLGLYVAVVALAPVMWRLHRKHGWLIVLALGIGAAVVDTAHLGLGVPHIDIFNYALVWLVPHQLGYLVADGRLRKPGLGGATAMAAAGLVGLVVATTAGGYPTSMIGVPGEDRWNTGPPALPLIALTLWLVGLALLFAPMVRSRMRAAPTRRIVMGFNGSVLTMYLWHVSALIPAAAIFYPLGLLSPDVGSGAWWALRPIWLLALAPFLFVAVLVLRRFEVHPRPNPIAPTDIPATRHLATTLGVASVAIALLGFGGTGFNEVAGSTGEEVLGFEMNPLQNVLHLGIGLTLLWLAYRDAAQTVLAIAVGSTAYVVFGLIGWFDGLGLLAMNPAMARFHAVVGFVGLALLVSLLARDRARSPARLALRSRS